MSENAARRPRPPSLVIDCDGGIDDALALMYLAAQREVEIVAAGSVWGNVNARQAADNILSILELCGSIDVPVAVGAANPLSRPFIPYDGVHGADGLGNTGQPPPRGRPGPASAAEQLVQLARARPGELTVLATGPLTNLAIACLLEPRLADLLAGVVVMGGAFDVPGNVTALAEANIWGDPEAAQLALNSGLAVTLVSLDVTMQVVLEARQLEPLRHRSALGAFAWRMSQQYFDFYEPRMGRRAAPMHDPLAAALVVEPGLAGYERVAVEVLTVDGSARGATVIDRRPWLEQVGTVDVARTVDADRVVQHLLDALR